MAKTSVKVELVRRVSEEVRKRDNPGRYTVYRFMVHINTKDGGERHLPVDVLRSECPSAATGLEGMKQTVIEYECWDAPRDIDPALSEARSDWDEVLKKIKPIIEREERSRQMYW